MIENHLNQKGLKKEKKVYTEKEYWDGLVPDDEFEEYLQTVSYTHLTLPTIRSV